MMEKFFGELMTREVNISRLSLKAERNEERR